jgi:hypothetical protein
VFFSLGLIALLFLAMSQGFTFALNAAIVGFFLLIAIYIGELLLVGLEFFSPSIENENAIAGKKNSLIALIFVILSVLLYLVTDG